MIRPQWLLLVAGVVLGCATTGGMRNAPEAAGSQRSFAANYDAVLEASREAVVEAGLTIEQVDKVSETKWVIVAKKAGSSPIFS